MMNYKPLFGNPLSFGDISTDAPAELSVQAVVSNDELPAVFFDAPGAWDVVNSIADLYFEGLSMGILAPVIFDALDLSLQQQIFALASAVAGMDIDLEDERPAEVTALVNAMADAEGVSSPLDEIVGPPVGGAGDEELVGPPEDGVGDPETDGPILIPGRDAAVALVTGALSSVFPFQDLSSHDIFFVTLETVEQLQDSLGRELTEAQVVEALETFNNVAFPTYEPTELIACLTLVAEGQDQVLQVEEASILTNDSREDAFCSNRNKAIILAAFGNEAVAKFESFCAHDKNGRLSIWTGAAGRCVCNILGVDTTNFEQFVLDSFDNRTADDLAELGSLVLEDLVEDVVENVRQSPETALEGTGKSAKSAEGGSPNILLGGAVAAAAVVGLVMLHKQINKYS
jgi:hypothetical protein